MTVADNNVRTRYNNISSPITLSLSKGICRDVYAAVSRPLQTAVLALEHTVCTAAVALAAATQRDTLTHL